MSQTTLRNMNMAEYLQDPERKQRYVTKVFEIVAPSYDRFTRWCSAGLDMAWKRELLAMVKCRLAPEHRVVDLACGTGDLTFAVSRLVPQGEVLGLDVAEPMIHLAQQRLRRLQVPNVSFQVGDMMALPFPEGSVDGVTVGYGLRNVPDPHRALAEIHRVLRPGGFLASLDFTRPANPLWRWLFLQYLLLAGSFYGWLWHREPAAYAYLAESIARFNSAPEMSAAMSQAGFEVLSENPWLFGAVCIHLARKKP
jgi:demethylmenaquinone methyltransferase/2-methoxy-6-polyprenyl-1,4-benzoquinol methylase